MTEFEIRYRVSVRPRIRDPQSHRYSYSAKEKERCVLDSGYAWEEFLHRVGDPHPVYVEPLYARGCE